MRELKNCEYFVLVGDINTMHKKIDIKAYKDNERKAGFLPEERVWLDLWFDKTGKKNIFSSYNNSKTLIEVYQGKTVIKYPLPETNELEGAGLGLYDVVREKLGEEEIYSFWSWKGKAKENYEKTVNYGRRIDYQIASESMYKSVISTPEIYGNEKVIFEERWSDHAPVVVTYDL